ncbi:hypothetical protein [Bacillus massilinigeriensis]|uniref:hypothetical protein n=1 Tax=Bacillus massilionigeriensis TaxID=1805475 RepID=UPI00096AFDD9|nr:hypothetical protein [Bacillus massilionigeriensis]
MKEILQQVKEELERAYSHPDSTNLDESIQQLQNALKQYGDKGTMIQNLITAVTQANHSMAQMKNAQDFSPSIAFGQAHNALEQAIESYNETDNDPI